MQKIWIMLNEDGSVAGYSEIGFGAGNGVELNLDDKYIDEIITKEYRVNQFFKENYMYFKKDGNNFVYDESLKTAEEEAKKREEEEAKKREEQEMITTLENDIEILTKKIEFYKKNNRDTLDIEFELMMKREELKKLKK